MACSSAESTSWLELEEAPPLPPPTPAPAPLEPTAPAVVAPAAVTWPLWPLPSSTPAKALAVANTGPPLLGPCHRRAATLGVSDDTTAADEGGAEEGTAPASPVVATVAAGAAVVAPEDDPGPPPAPPTPLLLLPLARGLRPRAALLKAGLPPGVSVGVRMGLRRFCRLEAVGRSSLLPLLLLAAAGVPMAEGEEAMVVGWLLLLVALLGRPADAGEAGLVVVMVVGCLGVAASRSPLLPPPPLPPPPPPGVRGREGVDMWALAVATRRLCLWVGAGVSVEWGSIDIGRRACLSFGRATKLAMRQGRGEAAGSSEIRFIDHPMHASHKRLSDSEHWGD